jgi:hypothetical protein
MTILKETTGETVACDGCGRSQDAGAALGIEPYAVLDPNVGSAVQHHYCAGCSANRGLTEPVATIAGWEAAPPPWPGSDDTTPVPEEPSEPPVEPA